ncbi:MAG: fasciclin domain-containing protein [Stigonema ocellatum SAG 48.90 = DSM 106950]|nr:fasciclin domain-containing protein [Stigonema ocellatum SAG 48.90 = DSM 106950]
MSYLHNLTKKLAVVTSIISISAFVGVPVMAQMGSDQKPANTTGTPADVPPTQAPGNNSPTPPDSNNAAGGNILQVAQSSGSFNTLAKAIEAAGLTKTLSSGSYTVFAPTDQAFASLPQGALAYLLKPENKNLLRQVLAYHVVKGKVTSNKLKTGSVKTLGGEVAVRVAPQGVTVNNANVTQPDIQASNGVIHAVDQVLLSPEVRRTLTSKLSGQ